MTVRIATPADENGLVTLCRLNHEENGAHPFFEPYVRGTIQRGILRQNAIIGVIGPSDKLEGFVLILIDPVWYSTPSERQLLELMNFVHPDFRRSSNSKDLIAFAKKAADETGLDLTIGVLSNIRTEAKIRLYKQQLPLAGAFFVYQPPKKADAKNGDAVSMIG